MFLSLSSSFFLFISLCLFLYFPLSLLPFICFVLFLFHPVINNHCHCDCWHYHSQDYHHPHHLFSPSLPHLHSLIHLQLQWPYLLSLPPMSPPSPQLPPYVLLVLCCTSYRVHSILVLRLFNDSVAVLFLFAAMNLFIENHWALASAVYRCVCVFVWERERENN